MATKTRRQTPPGEPAYHRLTDEKRIQIETLVKEGYAHRQIAAILGVSPSAARHPFGDGFARPRERALRFRDPNAPADAGFWP